MEKDQLLRFLNTPLCKFVDKVGQDLEGNGGEGIESQAVYLSYDGSRLSWGEAS